MVINLTENNSILSRFIYELRHTDIQQDMMRFRKNLERIGEIAAYEISKNLQYQNIKINTCLGEACCSLPAEKPVLAGILRAGLPLHQGLLNYFDFADNAFISAFRKHNSSGSFDIQLEYCTCPDLTGRILIICDPMLATGSSAVLTVKELEKFGKASQVHLVCAIAAEAGIEKVKKDYPEIKIWAGAVDKHLDSRAYIVPGLGDAGDLAFGKKLQC